jgi:hypothetical protein
MTRTARGVATLLVALAIAAPAAAQTAALTQAEQREFLLKARVVSSRPAGKGITGSLRLTLNDGQITHDASFQSIEDRATIQDKVSGRRRAGEVNFADSYKYNIAAYELAQLLGLGHMMPVTVERRWNGKIGSLTWWVDDVLMDEADREKSNTQPPSALDFQRQRLRMFTFAELIRDTDRNKGNVLYTKDWRVIMIDFTRAFRLEAQLRTPDLLQQIDRRLLEALRTLTDQQLRAAAAAWLTRDEINAVIARRKLIVERFDRLIKERGEAAILY